MNADILFGRPGRTKGVFASRRGCGTSMGRGTSYNIPFPTVWTQIKKEEDMGEVPKVGDKAHDFELSDSQGSNWALKDLLHDGDVMLVFFRGLW